MLWLANKIEKAEKMTCPFHLILSLIAYIIRFPPGTTDILKIHYCGNIPILL